MSSSPQNASDDEWIGPKPEEAAPEPKRKKRRILEHEQLYLSNLPTAQYYEKSYMHRDVVTHVVCTPTDFIITGSCDGHIKFWKKQELGIEFVKHYRAHLGNVQHLCYSVSGRHLASISNDKSLKIFDVENFDMINMVNLDFVPQTCEWIHPTSDPEPLLAVSDSATNAIHIFIGLQASSTPLKTLDSIHTESVQIIKYNAAYDVIVSIDKLGMIDYWSGRNGDYQIPNCVKFESKLDTDLFEFVKSKTQPLALAISPNGQLLATIGSDKMVRIFKFLTGKLTRVYDESIKQITELQQSQQQISNMDFGRRLAVEREMDKGSATTVFNLQFDESSNFLIYSTLLGVKIVNVVTNKLARHIGKLENLRILSVSLFQGKISKSKVRVTEEMVAAENPTLSSEKADPTIVATAFKKNRFYLFTNRDSTDPKSSETDRDIFNEKPSKEDIIASTDIGGGQRVYDTAIMHTTLGDIQVKLFAKECPRTVENFCVHAKNGYYNGHLFHRVIKQFMIQTGDPMGTGVGGESIWGGEFEDEFHPTLKHDRPYTLSMANAGPNTNGSQFFITVVPAPWLDNKHTVFGRVTRGLETVQSISNSKTNPKTDKPYEDITIVSVSLK